LKRKFCFLVEFPFGGGPKKTITNFIYDYKDTLAKRPIGASLVHYNNVHNLVKKVHFKNIKDSESFAIDYLHVTDLIRVCARKIEKQTIKIVEAKFVQPNGKKEVTVLVGNYKLLYDRLGEIVKAWTKEINAKLGAQKTPGKRIKNNNSDL